MPCHVFLAAATVNSNHQRLEGLLGGAEMRELAHFSGGLSPFSGHRVEQAPLEGMAKTPSLLLTGALLVGKRGLALLEGRLAIQQS